MEHEIKQRLTKIELLTKCNEISKQYCDKYYKHKNGDLYYAGKGTTININGTSYWGVLYHPCDNETRHIIFPITHTRLLCEFLDGRFELIE